MSRIVLAMSGGVDSSVAAHLLLEQGHEVIGVFMRHGEESPVAACDLQQAAGDAALQVLQGRPDHKQGCCSASDAEDARRVADCLGIPFYALNLQAEFGKIIDYFVDEYVSGRTPNPCVVCNQWLKFGRLFDYADSVGAEFLATGHYARIVREADDGARRLARGLDHTKDQSYALFGVSRESLQRMILPVGDYEKTKIRSIATDLGLRVADKRDSQEICFVTSGRHDEFIRQRLGNKPDRSGEFVTADGTVVGKHNGIERFTVGQRKGLGIALGEPHFVIRIEPETRRVVLGKKEELACSQLTASGTNWLVDVPSKAFRCQAKIRYNAQPVDAEVEVLPENRMRLAFPTPCYGVAPGQAVVCYDGETVLGGGWID